MHGDGDERGDTVPEEQTPRPTLDDIDVELLRHLQADSRTSIRGLARNVGMSAGAIGERLERLEASGVIKGYRVDIDAAALGLGMETLIGVQLSQNDRVIETMERLIELPEVIAVELVTGSWDLIVRLRLRDPEHLRNVLTSDIWHIATIRHTESMLVLDSRSDLRFAPTT